MNELKPEEIGAYRAEAAREAWDDDSIKEVATKVEEEEREEIPETDELPEEDEQEELPSYVKEMMGKLDVLEKIDYRLNQAEKRIGSVQQTIHNQMQAAKEATKHVTNAPDREQIAAAAKSDADWSELKEEYPEWSELMDGLEKRMEARKPVMPDVESIRTQLQTDFEQRLNKQQREFEVKLVGIAHKDWKEKASSKDFDQWLVSQSEDLKKKALSQRADDVIDLLDRYDTFKAEKNEETPEEIARKRKERLARSTNPKTTGRAAKVKSEADMSPEELRAHLAKQYWPDN